MAAKFGFVVGGIRLSLALFGNFVALRDGAAAVRGDLPEVEVLLKASGVARIYAKPRP